MSSRTNSTLDDIECMETLLRRISVANNEADAVMRENPITVAVFVSKHSALPELWLRLFHADQTNNLTKIYEALRAILALNPSEWRNTLQTLEKLFRANRMHTWLIARKKDMPTQFAMPANNGKGTRSATVVKKDIEGSPTDYYLWMVCNEFPALGIVELLEESTSYHENFEKLRGAGFLTAVD